MAKVQNQPIHGDDQQWKRAAEEDIIRLEGIINNLQQQINYLKNRVK